MHTLARKFKSFLRTASGVAYLEFAVTLPFMLALFMGSVDLTRYILIAQKVEKVAVSVSDLVAQSETINTAQLNILILAAGEVMQPYSFGSEGFVVISSVSKNGNNPPTVNWQYTGGGTWNNPSQIGVSGGTATMPAEFTMQDKETVIIAEVFFNYSPMIANSVLNSQVIYKLAVYRPRLGNLKTIGS